MDIVIKQATAADVAALSSIVAKSWKHAYAGVVDQRFLDGLQGDEWAGIFTQWIESGEPEMLVAVADGVYAGCASYGESREEGMSGQGEIAIMYLLPECIGRGVGHALMQATLDCLAKSFDKCHLWVLRENARARAFYEKHGFQYSGHEKTVEVAGGAVVNCMYMRELL